MSFFEFPFTRTYSDDLGWIIRELRDLADQVENKTIKYADPINWDITKQYEVNTVVLDGTVAYLSKQAVPSGIGINDTDYWQAIFDIAPIVGDMANIRDQISAHYEENYTATANYNEGDWLFVHDGDDDLLYYTLTAISINGGLVPDVNIKKATVEDIVKAIITDVSTLQTDVGDLADLITTDKTSIVNAINEIKYDEIVDAGDIAQIISDIGDMTSLTTPVTSDLVAALNSVQTEIDNQKSGIYINVKDYGAVGDGVTDDTAAINDALTYAQTFDLGATLFFPAGEYLISSTITIPYVSGHGLGGISILGEGRYASVIFANTDIDLIEYVGDDTDPNDAYNLFGISIQNIYLRYTGGNSTKTGISFTHCHQVLMLNVRIRYFKTGVYLSHCPNSTFIGVGISANVADARGFDVGDRSVSNAYISCFFAASGNAANVSAHSAGFYAKRGNISDMNIIYFDVGGATYGVYIDGVNTTTNQTGDINIIDLVCESWFGVWLNNINRHGNVNIIGGWFNCQTSPNRQGVYLSGNCIGISINGAKFVNNIGSGTTDKTAVYIGSGCGDISITNCNIKNQNALNCSSTGDGLIFCDNIVELESGVNVAGALVSSNFKHSLINNNVIKGECLYYIRWWANVTYSYAMYNLFDNQQTNGNGYAFDDRTNGNATVIWNAYLNG